MAFDEVCHEGLWNVAQKFNIEEALVRSIEAEKTPEAQFSSTTG